MTYNPTYNICRRFHVARKADPNTRYKVYRQRDGKYHYASVQVPNPPDSASKSKYKIVHIGTVDPSLVFTPNANFRLLDVEERVKYIFPHDWDISKLTAMNDEEYAKKALLELISKEQVSPSSNSTQGPIPLQTSVFLQDENNDKEYVETDGDVNSGVRPSDSYLDQYNNKLYGSFWILQQISINQGVYEDLLTTFRGNIAKVNEVMSLAFYPYLSERNFNRFSKWQNTHETLLEYPMPAPAITKLTQSITDNDRMTLIQLRINRLPKDAAVDCDSTTRSAWGKCLADIHWGKNKDNEKLRNTLEVFVYSLTTHQPIYYRSFAGNTSDMSTVRTVLKDLLELGMTDVVFTADRGYCSDENIASLVAAELPFLLCAKTGVAPIAPLLRTLKYDSDGVPLDMEYDEDSHLYMAQVNVPVYQSRLCDGTPVIINNVKANLFLDLGVRIQEVAAIKREVDAERESIDEDIKKSILPDNIKKYNALLSYHKAYYLYDDDKKPIGIAYEPLTDKISKEKSQCGFFSSLMYRQTKTAKEALADYKARDEHEKNFDQMKNQMMFRVQRNSSQDGKDGRSFILFIGLIAISILREAWRSSNEMQRSYTSTYDMLDEMESIRMSRYTDGSSHMTTFTGRQVDIAMAANIEVPLECMSPSVRKEYQRKVHSKEEKQKSK